MPLTAFWNAFEWHLYNIFLKTNLKKRRRSYHGGILRRSFHEAWYYGLQASQQLCVDGHLEEAVEVLAMWEAQEVMAMTSRYRHREHDSVQQQVHQLLTLQRNSNIQQAASSETLGELIH